MLFFLYFFTCFILGSIPFAYLVAKLVKGIDIREYGSKNPGATNIRRVMGWKYGLLVLLLDLSKGFFSLYIFQFFRIESFYNLNFNTILIIGGLFSTLGHTFTPFLKFKGGKGAATSLGVFLYLSPIACLFSIIIFITIIKITRIVSIGTISAAISLPLLHFLNYYFYYGMDKFSWNIFYVMIAVLVLVLIRHKDNIQRIMKGTENRI